MKITSTKLTTQILKKEKEPFEPAPFGRADAEHAFESFSENGRVYYKKLGLFKKDLEAEQATARLRGDYRSDPKPVYVELPGGKVHKVRWNELQQLDTFQGTGATPAAPPDVVDALKSLDRGVDTDDGLFRDGFAFTPEKKLNAFESYRALTAAGDRAGKAALKGAAVGAGVAVGVGLAAAGASLLFPGIVPPGLGVAGLVAAGGATLGVGAGVGSALNFVHYKNQHPEELEVRNGQDSGLKIRNLDHAVETHDWLVERARNPFTETQQHQAAEYLAEKSGLYQGGRKIDADKALERLREGKTVRVPSSIPDHFDGMESIRHLQQMDTVRGLGVNPVLPQEVSTSLRFLESGVSGGDGLFRRGEFEPKGRLSAFEAVDYLFREREPIGVRIRDKNYQTRTLANIQELNALKGDGDNTILPEGPFQSLLFFDQKGLMKTPEGGALDSYEALQEMNEDRSVLVPSEGRDARALEPADLHELRSLEFDKTNDILPQRDYDLLQYWQGHGGYQVDGETDGRRAYEALQSLQDGAEFGVNSKGRFAPALTFQDLEDLATFEAPEAGFPNHVPPQDQDRLTYFQDRHEAKGLRPVRVGEREGRAYEGYRELRDGKPFDVRAGGVWNQIRNSQGLHDLDALLGRGVNDILPQDQYDLLKHLGDGAADEGLATGGHKLNSYAALQEFRDGRPISYDFHGGDFGELLQIPTENLEALENTKKLRDNQKEYDKYAYPVPEWQDKMQRQFQQTPSFGQENLEFGEHNLSRGRSKLRRGESDLSSARSDLSRARSDLSYAESELSRARSMPMYNTKYRRVCDSNNRCHQESYQEYNWQRQSAISRAQSKVSEARRKISRAESDIREAESLISRARSDIRRAEAQIDDARRLLGMLPNFEELLSGVNEQNYQQAVKMIDSALETMKTLSHVTTLDTNLRHQTQLISNMAARPKRPQGWSVPEPLVQR